MEQGHKKVQAIERTDEDAIVVDVAGKFPRPVIIMERGEKVGAYRLIKTKNGGFALNK